MGIAADDSAIYFSTGNGPFTANMLNGRDYGDTVLKLRLPGPVGTNGVMTVADYFTPWNQWELNKDDLDVGSGGVMILPDLVAGSKLLMQCGKTSTVFVLNRDNLGKYGGPPPNLQPPPNTTFHNNVVDDSFTLDGGGVWGGPAYCIDSSGKQIVFYCGTNGHVNRLTFDASKHVSLLGKTTDTFAGGAGEGFTVTISSNGSLPGTGIVWLVDRNKYDSNTDPNPNPANLDPANLVVTLFAFDVQNLQNKLVELPAGSWSDEGNFTDPTVVDGKVFVGSENQVAVFGLDAALGPQ